MLALKETRGSLCKSFSKSDGKLVQIIWIRISPWKKRSFPTAGGDELLECVLEQSCRLVQQRCHCHMPRYMQLPGAGPWPASTATGRGPLQGHRVCLTFLTRESACVWENPSWSWARNTDTKLWHVWNDRIGFSCPRTSSLIAQFDIESACNAGDPGSIPGPGRSPGEGIGYPLQYSWASLVAQLVKNPPAMQETWFLSLGLGRSPGEGKGYPLQYSGLENSMDSIVHGVEKSRTWLSDFHFWLLHILVVLSISSLYSFPLSSHILAGTSPATP